VRIKVAAAGVNPADWRLRSGQFRIAMRLRLPFVPGSDIAGVVEAVGAEVHQFRPGDPVYAMTPAAQGGGYAERAIVAAEQVARAPQGISFAEAAGTPLVALTALQALRDKAQLRAGQRLLVYGASGGVGSFAVQIGKAMGAEVTAATSGRNRELVRGLSADEVLDYTRDDVAAARERYDVIFDAVNVLSFGKMRPALRPGGVMVSVNPIIEQLSPAWLARFRGGRRLRSLFVQPSSTDLAQLAQWIAAGQVRAVLDRTYPLAEAAAAHMYSASG
jgi:NADPH:quinone reductase-like Zn-dependent oxidoreductase